jgi:hypothetical protein
MAVVLDLVPEPALVLELEPVLARGLALLSVPVLVPELALVLVVARDSMPEQN